MTTPQDNIPNPDMIGRVVRLTIKPIAALKEEVSARRLSTTIPEFVGTLQSYFLSSGGDYTLNFGDRGILIVHPGLQDLTFEVRVD